MFGQRVLKIVFINLFFALVVNDFTGEMAIKDKPCDMLSRGNMTHFQM